MTRRLSTLRAAAGLAALGSLLVAQPAMGHAAATSTVGCKVRVTRWVFQPSTVAPGGQTTLTLTLRNCTQRVRRVSVIWFGSGQNCPTMDPAPPTSLRLGPGARRTKTWPMTAPPCGSNGGQESVTVRVSNRSGQQLATRTTTLTVTAAS